MAEGDALGASLVTDPSGNSTAAETAQSSNAASTSGEGLKFEGFDDKERTRLARFKSHNDLGKSYLELEKRLGASIVLPGPNATEQDKAAFYEKLGRPSSQDGYELEPVFLPDGVTRADFGEADYKKAAFTIGLTKDQAKQLHKWAVMQSLELAKEAKRKFETRKKESLETLQREHGEKYKDKMARVGKLGRRFGGDDWISYLNRGAGNDPELLRFLIAVGDAISEDTLESGRPVPLGEQQRPGVLHYDKRPELYRTRVTQ